MASSEFPAAVHFHLLIRNVGSIVPRVLPTLQTRMMTHRNKDEKHIEINLRFVLEFNRRGFLGLLRTDTWACMMEGPHNRGVLYVMVVWPVTGIFEASQQRR